MGGVTILHVLKMFEALADAGPAVRLSSTRQMLLQAGKGLMMPAVNMMMSRLPQP